MRELTSDTLAQEIKQNQKVVVQYGASWCGACRLVKPKFAALAEKNQDVIFYYVDAELFPLSRQLANVENLPTFAGFVNGELVKEGFGTREESILEVLNEVASH